MSDTITIKVYDPKTALDAAAASAEAAATSEENAAASEAASASSASASATSATASENSATESENSAIAAAASADAANVSYEATQLANYLLKAGGEVTGNLTVDGTFTGNTINSTGALTGSSTGTFSDNVMVGTTTVPRNPITGRNYLVVKGSTGLGAVELTSAASDADAKQLGHIAFVDSNCSVSENGVAFVTGYTDGSTSTNRGGALSFVTKPDGGTTTQERMRITQAGYVGIDTTTPTAALDLPASTTTRAALRIRTGTEPTTPNIGDMWVSSTDNLPYYYDGTTTYTMANTTAVYGYGDFTNVVSTVTGNTAATISGDYCPYTKASFSSTINFATTGAGGLDTGSIAASAGYFGYRIYNPTTATGACIASTSSTANGVTLPSGYTKCVRLCSNFRTNSSSYLYRIIQHGVNAQYIIDGTILTGMRQLASGTASLWTAESVSSYVPTTASAIKLSALCPSNNAIGLAPNSTYGSTTSTSNPPPLVINVPSGTPQSVVPYEMELESTSVYWYSSGSGYLYCRGWRDNF